jgi:hypothetical protein
LVNLKVFFEVNGTINPFVVAKNNSNSSIIPPDIKKPNLTLVGEIGFGQEVSNDRIRLFYSSRDQVNSPFRSI